MANILVSGVRMDMGGTEIAQIKFMKKLLDEGHKVTWTEFRTESVSSRFP